MKIQTKTVVMGMMYYRKWIATARHNGLKLSAEFFSLAEAIKWAYKING